MPFQLGKPRAYPAVNKQEVMKRPEPQQSQRPMPERKPMDMARRQAAMKKLVAVEGTSNG